MSSRWDRNHGPPLSSQMFYQLSYWGPCGELFGFAKWFFLSVAHDFNKKSPDLNFSQIMSLLLQAQESLSEQTRASEEEAFKSRRVQVILSDSFFSCLIITFEAPLLYIFLTLLIQSSILGGMRKPQAQIRKGEEKRFVWCGRWNSSGGN